MRFLLLALAFTLFNIIPNYSIAQDSSITQTQHVAADTNVIKTANTDIPQPDDEFNLFLFAFALAAMCFIAGCFFVGVVAAIIIVAITILLISIGIISTSVFIGWYKRSLSAGFRLFCLISGSLCGLLLGAVSFGVISHLMKLQLTTTTASLSGGAIGLLTGALVGFMIYKLLRVGFQFIATKFKLLKDRMAVQA